MVLLLMLVWRCWKLIRGLLFGLLLASTALVSEPVFAVVSAGIVAGLLLRWLLRCSLSDVAGWLWTLFPGLALVPFMGGTLMATLGNWIFLSPGRAPAGIMVPQVDLRWHPVLLSARLGLLVLTDPGQLVIALLEIGPLLLLGPAVTLAAFA